MQVITCPQCGGSVEISGNDAYATCKFCDNKLYFKDNEVMILASSLREKDKIIETDEVGTKQSLKHKRNTIIGTIYCSLFYLVSGVWMMTYEFGPAFGAWGLGILQFFILMIVQSRDYGGYDVYKNRYNGRGSRLKFFIVNFLIGKAACLAVMFAAIVVTALVHTIVNRV